MSLSIRGWQASFSRMRRPVLIRGRVPWSSMLSFPFEKMKSSFSMVRRFCAMASPLSATWAVRV